MKLFFDTETTGKALFKAPPNHPAQPRIVQLAAILFDEEASECGSLNVIIKPDGWTIPDEAAAIHGITTAKALACGIPIMSALAVFSNFLHLADMLIAHNIDFDELVVSCDLVRLPNSGAQKCFDRLGEINTFCTMKNTTQICQLPGNYGDFKWPKLNEAHKHLFGTDVEDAHDAMADVRACARIYFEITKAKVEA